MISQGKKENATATAVHVHCAGEAEEEKKEETVSSAFVGDLEAAVKLFVEKWQDHPEGANALAQKHEPDLVRLELRPLVFEEVRLQVDEEMRVLLQNLKVSLCKTDRPSSCSQSFAWSGGPWHLVCSLVCCFLLPGCQLQC